jgi:hypothetical protein
MKSNRKSFSFLFQLASENSCNGDRHSLTYTGQLSPLSDEGTSEPLTCQHQTGYEDPFLVFIYDETENFEQPVARASSENLVDQYFCHLAANENGNDEKTNCKRDSGFPDHSQQQLLPSSRSLGDPFSRVLFD